MKKVYHCYATCVKYEMSDIQDARLIRLNIWIWSSGEGSDVQVKIGELPDIGGIKAMRLNDVAKGLNVHKRGNRPKDRGWNEEEEPAKEPEKELLENTRKARRVCRHPKPGSQVKTPFRRSIEGRTMPRESRWGLKIGFNNMDVIGFDTAVSTSSRKSHIRVHFRKNKKRGNSF